MKMKSAILTAMICTVLFGCANTNSNTPNPIKADTNFLGGTGEIRFINQNPSVLADDTQIYNGFGMYHSKTITDGQVSWKSLCQDLGCTHDRPSCLLYQYFQNNAKLFPGLNELLLQRRNQIFRLNSDGNITEVFTLDQVVNPKKAGESLQPESVVFNTVMQLNEQLYYFDAFALTDEETDVRCSGFYNSSQEKMIPLPDNLLPIDCFLSSDQQAVWFLTDSDKPCRILTDTLEPDLSVPDFPDSVLKGYWFETEGVIYYCNYLEQYCSFDIRSGTKQLLSQDLPFLFYFRTEKDLVAVDMTGKKLFRCRYDLSEKTELPLPNDVQEEINAILYADESGVEISADGTTFHIELNTERSGFIATE